MNEYHILAKFNVYGGSINDRYTLHADTFEQACETAQQWELDEAAMYDREPTMYNEFIELKR